DLQNAIITLRILFQPVSSQLSRVYTSIGEDYGGSLDAGELVTQQELTSDLREGVHRAVEGSREEAQQEAERLRKLGAAEDIAYQLSLSEHHQTVGQLVLQPPQRGLPCLHLLRPTRPGPQSFLICFPSA
ncbi:Prohibitin 1 (Fragments), partial [Lemmus lemmus]